MSRAGKLLSLNERIQIAAGILFKNKNDVLLLKRSRQVFDPGMWGISGGSMDRDSDDPLDTAIRETYEEMKVRVDKRQVVGKYIADVSHKVKQIWSPSGQEASGLHFYTYIVEIDDQQRQMMKPILNWENDAWTWVTIPTAMNNHRTHPGVKEVLKNLSRVIGRPR